MNNFVQLIVLVLTFVTLAQSFSLDIGQPTLPDDGILDEYKITPKIISSYGYPVESHYVTTEDGYILGLFRIPHGKNRKADPQKKPVYLQHGLACSSGVWVIAGPNISKAFTLADEGYDVWLGNHRGNTYSRRHKYLSPNETKFWDFSFHEIALNDLPAMIDYILEKTNNKQLLNIGHSMGCTLFYIMSIFRPEYNDKILGHISLGPVNYFWRTRSLFFRVAAPYANQIKTVVDLVAHGELLTRTPGLDSTLKLVCTKGELEKNFCQSLVYFFCGYDDAQNTPSLIPSIVADVPAGTSVKTFVHYEQLLNSKRFCQYDYGTVQNLLKYNSPTPPDYNIAAVKSKVVVISGDNDLSCDVEDVHEFYRQLSSDTALGFYKVNFAKFAHMDYLWANDVRTLVDNDVLEILSSFETNETPNVKSLIRVENV